MHERTRIRNHVREILQRAAVVDPSRITKSRYQPFSANEQLPALSIYTLGQEGRDHSVHQHPVLDEEVTLRIDCYVALSAGWDDALDELCEGVEQALLENPAFMRGFSGLKSFSTSIEHSTKGEFHFAVAMLNLVLTFRSDYQPELADDLHDISIGVGGFTDVSIPVSVE